MSRAKKRMVSEQYYNLTEDEMQAIIIVAKTHDHKAQVEMLEIFSNFLSKYSTMLYHNKYSLGDYDIRKFVGLFVKSNVARKKLHRNKLDTEAAKEIHEVMRGIHYMIRRYGDFEDVEQTINLTFIQCVDRYERKGEIPFSAYLYSYYFYMLKKNVELLLIDQLGRKTFPLISDSDMSDDWDSGEKTVGFTAPPSPAADEFLFAEKIDEDWVEGLTAYAPFDNLTIQERQLIKWKYVNGDRASEIARKITEHPNTVREHLAKIRKKIEYNIQNDLKI